MTDVSDVPTIYTGDYIDAAWINQYIGDNFRAVMQGFGAAGTIPYGVDADTIAGLVKPSTEGLMNMGSDGVPEWLTTTNQHNFLQWNGSAFVFAPPIYKRIGGDASNWASTGSTAYTPSGKVVRVIGSSSVTVNTTGDLSITYSTFGITWASKPLVSILGLNASGGDFAYRLHDETVSGFGCHIRDVITSGSLSVEVHWALEGVLA